MTHSWLWHLFNDPMRDNPWTFAFMLSMVALVIVYVWRVR